MYIPEAWHVIAIRRELRRAHREPVALRRFGLDLALWRDAEGKLRAVLDRCPHRSASLSAGAVEDGQIECPFHGFRWDGEGNCVKVPCNGPEAQRPRHLANTAFELREAHDMVWMWWGQPRAAGDYPELPWSGPFTALDEGYVHDTLVETTQVGWMRNVENQLDWAHLPFAHHNTIGAGFPHDIEVRAELDGDLLSCWPAHYEDAEGVPHTPLHYMFPNTWIMAVGGPNNYSVIAFAPVDATHTRMYLRTYVKRGRVPGLAALIARVFRPANRVIFKQDQRIIETQPPGGTVGARDEKLVQADLPIALFRKEVRRRMEAHPELAGSDGDGQTVQLRLPSERAS